MGTQQTGAYAHPNTDDDLPSGQSNIVGTHPVSEAYSKAVEALYWPDNSLLKVSEPAKPNPCWVYTPMRTNEGTAALMLNMDKTVQHSEKMGWKRSELEKLAKEQGRLVPREVPTGLGAKMA